MKAARSASNERGAPREEAPACSHIYALLATYPITTEASVFELLGLLFIDIMAWLAVVLIAVKPLATGQRGWGQHRNHNRHHCQG
jgi:hypothetical protein